MSSSAPHAQNSAASVMSMTISVVARKRDLAAEQAEAGIDVAGEDLEETIDDAGAAHRSSPRQAAVGDGSAVADRRGGSAPRRSGVGTRSRFSAQCRQRSGSRRRAACAEHAGSGASSSRSGSAATLAGGIDLLGLSGRLDRLRGNRSRRQAMAGARQSTTHRHAAEHLAVR